MNGKIVSIVITGLMGMCTALMLGAIRWGVPAYAEEVAAETAKQVVEEHNEHEVHEKTQERQDQFDERLGKVETGVRILLQRSGGAPTEDEIRDSRDVLEDLE